MIVRTAFVHAARLLGFIGLATHVACTGCDEPDWVSGAHEIVESLPVRSDLVLRGDRVFWRRADASASESASPNGSGYPVTRVQRGHTIVVETEIGELALPWSLLVGGHPDPGRDPLAVLARLELRHLG